MKRAAAFALGLAIALPACAQRGGGHASFGSHSAPSFHSAPAYHSAPAFRGSRSPAFRYNGGARVAPSYRYPQRITLPGARYSAFAPAARPTFYNKNHPIIVNRPRHYPRGVGILTYPTSAFGYFPYMGFYDGFYDDGFYDSDYFDSGYAGPSDNSYAQPSDSGYAAAQPEYAPYPQQPQPDDGSAYSAPPPPGYMPYPYAYPQSAAPISPEMHYVPGSTDTITLIFKDGRPPEQIHNYLATHTTVTVIDGNHHRDIPIADLDVPATIQANRETGVGFQLPSARP